MVSKDNKEKSEGRSLRQNKPVTIILENSVGEKNSIGSKFDGLGLILDNLKSSFRAGSNRRNGSNKEAGSFGVCLDTYHAFAADYDLRTENGVNETLDKFSSEVGLKNLKCMCIPFHYYRTTKYQQVRVKYYFFN
ncbi:MAG TPA: hypothetical protein VI278_18390 [Nitrososphaeraceae archaeon]